MARFSTTRLVFLSPLLVHIRVTSLLYSHQGIFVGYRGYEIKNLAPLFPFGYGLSYTTFEYSGLKLSSISSEGKFSASFTIKNTGTVAGREIAQVYITDVVSSLPRPVKELHGFVKVALHPGEHKAVSVELDKYALSFYDERRASWIAEAGKFEVIIAASSEDVRLSSELELDKTFYWNGL
jgi:beta-glucosidase